MRSILITGASTGIGAACALGLEKKGFRVYAGVRSETAAQALQAQAGPNLTPLQLEVTDPASVARAVDAIEAEGGLGALWNNAGITVNGPMEFVPLEDLRRQLEVNVVAQVGVTQAFLPLLRRSRGRILFTGSVGGFFTTPMLGPYCMSKRALEALVDAWRVELRPWGIQVVLLQPGAIATPIWQKGVSESKSFRETAPAALRELYGGPMERLTKIALKEEAKAAPTDVVLAAAYEALTAPRPRDRYVMGGGAGQRRLLARLPVRLRDWLLARALGFTPRRK